MATIHASTFPARVPPRPMQQDQPGDDERLNVDPPRSTTNTPPAPQPTRRFTPGPSAATSRGSILTPRRDAEALQCHRVPDLVGEHRDHVCRGSPPASPNDRRRPRRPPRKEEPHLGPHARYHGDGRDWRAIEEAQGARDHRHGVRWKESTPRCPAAARWPGPARPAGLAARDQALVERLNATRRSPRTAHRRQGGQRPDVALAVYEPQDPGGL